MKGFFASKYVDRDRATWNATSNLYQEKGLNQKIEIELLIGYAKEQPFWVDFEIKAGLNFAGEVRWLGRKEKVTGRRHFAPPKEAGMVGSYAVEYQLM